PDRERWPAERHAPRPGQGLTSCSRTNNTSVWARRSQLHTFSSRLPLSFGVGRSQDMSDTTKPQGAAATSGRRIPGFAQLQRLGKSLMLPIAVLPAAGILLRLGQPDVLGKIQAPLISSFFQ